MGSSAVEKIINGIAVVEETAPRDLDVSLQEWIETDAIRQLVDHEKTTWELRFEVRDHDVRVRGDETVFVDGKQRPAPY